MRIRIRQGYNDLELVVEKMSDATEVIEAIVPYCEQTTSFTFVKEEEEEK